MSERLGFLVEAHRAAGVEPVAEGDGPLRAAIRAGRAYLPSREGATEPERIAHAGLDVLGKLAPVLEDATRDELVDVLQATWADSEGGAALDELSFQERRRLFNDLTEAEMADARKRAERLAMLADALEDAGDILLAALPIVLAAL